VSGEVEALLRRNLLEVFAQRDGDRRRAAIAELFAPDVVFDDPEGRATGHDGIDAGAARVLDGAPGEFTFAPAGEPSAVADLGRLSWTFGPAGAPPVVTGTDVALVADGRITRLWTFLESSPG
jgi:hypothetical protein